MELNIRDLLNNIQDSSVSMNEDQVVSAERIKELTKIKLQEEQQKHNRKGLKRFITIGVAVAVVSALGCATAYAIHEHKLKNMAIDSEPTIVTRQWTSPINGELIIESFEVQTISLQGYEESPEYMALKEWEDFLATYDPDNEILFSVGNSTTQWDEKYGLCGYTCYSQEMADKIDEIIAKYDLTLHPGPLEVFYMEEINSTYGPIMKDATYMGYYYPDGTIHLDGDFGEYGFQFRRSMKGVFDPIALNVGNIEDYEEWEYETSEGFTVLLALSEHKALILADLDDAFVSVNVLLDFSVSGNAKMSKEDLENMADHLILENL